MKNSKINYIVVGIFVLAMLAGLVVSTAMLTGRTGATDSYFTFYRNVSGIKFGTQVLYEGYPIGQVEEITPTEKNGRMWFRVDFGVFQGWRIPKDSTAQIAASGLLAAVALNIDAGNSATPLKPGAEVRGKEAANIFAVVSSVAADVSDLARDSLKPLLANINKTIGTFGALLEGDGKTLVSGLSALAKDVSTRAPRITDNIEAFSQKLNNSGDALADLLKPGNRKKLETLIDNMGIASSNVAELSGNLEDTRIKIDQLVVALNGMVLGNKDNVDKSISDIRHVTDTIARQITVLSQNLDGAARNMYEFSRQIRQNPGLLLGGTPLKDDAVNP
ncbi:MAG TPA: MCE family protein [Rhodospirillales bacterium]|nr:MCE family protein [Rhodospirillales bacterium]